MCVKALDCIRSHRYQRYRSSCALILKLITNKCDICHTHRVCTEINSEWEIRFMNLLKGFLFKFSIRSHWKYSLQTSTEIFSEAESFIVKGTVIFNKCHLELKPDRVELHHSDDLTSPQRPPGADVRGTNEENLIKKKKTQNNKVNKRLRFRSRARGNYKRIKHKANR